MQCPISVNGRECGADANTPSQWMAGPYDSTAVHFHCTHGHRFHIGPRHRWQLCRCGTDERTRLTTDRPALAPSPQDLLRRLAAEKGIEVIFE